MIIKTLLYRWIQKNKKKTENTAHFLTRVLDDPVLCHSFFNLIVKNPRENKVTYRSLRGAFLTPHAWTLWQKKYTGGYHQFMQVCWNKARCIEDVLKIIPNFSPWALKDRFGSIQIGKIPSEFGSAKQYDAFLEKIYNSKVMQRYRQFKALEQNLTELAEAYPAMKKIDWFDLDARTTFLCQTLNKIIGRAFRVVHLGHAYSVHYLCNPFSSKMVFQIESDTHKKYVLKMLAYQVGKIDSDAKRKESENQAIRADSPYSNALMEFYLKLNKCPHAPEILYYTDTHEAVLYRAEQGTEFSANQTLDFKTLNEKYLKDANRLGIYVNDISSKNFMWGKDKKLKIIDIGHASFANPLTPGIPGLTFSFGNLSGQDYLIHFGVLSMED